MERIRAVNLADWALAHGRPSLTTPEIAELLQIPVEQVRRRLNAPKNRGEWATLSKGLWLPVPAEQRAKGTLYPMDAIAPIMKHMGHNYYVGWLSAAARHGAAYHAIQLFQVAVDRPIHPGASNPIRVKYFVRTGLASLKTIEVPSRTSMVRISSIETTMLDISSDVLQCGGVSLSATVIDELSRLPDFSVAELGVQAKLFSAASIRRLGWMLSRLNPELNLENLRTIADSMSDTPARLNPSVAPKGPHNKIWNIYINSEFEPES